MSNSVAVSEVREFAVESPTGHLGYVDGFFLDESNWKIPAFRISTDQSPGVFRKQKLVLPQSWVERVDVSSRRIFLTQEPTHSGTLTPLGDLPRVEDLSRFEIHTLERSFGRVEDLIFNYKTWEIENLVVYTHKLFGGKHILLRPDQIQTIEWDAKKLNTQLHFAEIQNAPQFKPSNPLFQATHWFG